MVLHPTYVKGFYWIQLKYLKVRVEVSISVPNFGLLELPSFSLQSSVRAKGCKKKGFSETKETKDRTVIELWTTSNPVQTNLLFWIFKEKNLSTWQNQSGSKETIATCRIRSAWKEFPYSRWFYKLHLQSLHFAAWSNADQGKMNSDKNVQVLHSGFVKNNMEMGMNLTESQWNINCVTCE